MQHSEIATCTTYGLPPNGRNTKTLQFNGNNHHRNGRGKEKDTLQRSIFAHLQLKTIWTQSSTARKYNRRMVQQMFTPTWVPWQMPVARAWEAAIVSECRESNTTSPRWYGSSLILWPLFLSDLTCSCAARSYTGSAAAGSDNFMSHMFQQSESGAF